MGASPRASAAAFQPASRPEARDQAQHACLLSPFELRLEADEAVVIGSEIVLPQLGHRIRDTADPRIEQTDRLHRSEPKSVAPAVRHDLNRQAALEEPLA